MKLYTEEQVKEIYFKGVHNGRLHIEGKCSDEVELLIPIELPSDEEIKKMMELDGMEFDEFDPYDVSYLGGATWMRNKIQGGNNDKQQTAMKLYTQHQLLNTAEAIKNYYENSPDTAQEMVKKHLMNLAPITTKRTLIIYNTKETTEEEARHLLEILNCDDSTLWDNADHCGVQVIEVPLTYGGGEQ